MIFIDSFSYLLGVLKRFDKKAGTSDARMPLPEPNDLDKAGQLRFEELEESLKQLNKDLKGILSAQNSLDVFQRSPSNSLRIFRTILF